jgi:hypothetical protein
MFLPTWTVQYVTRRPTLTRGLTMRDRGEIEVAGLDRDHAAAAFRQRFPSNYRIEAIFPKSATGFA